MTRCDKLAVQRYRQIWFWLLLWIAFVPGVQAATDCNAVTEIPVSECQSLLELYNSTNGPNWKHNTGWNQTNTPCSWYCVTCDVGHVSELACSLNGLSGSIPNFSNLPNLTELQLAANQLSGNIPNFSNLPNLTELFLFMNQLSGSIPDFSNLPNLTGLYLAANQLSGNIPNFSNLPNLKQLYFSSNQLSGSIPNFTAFNLADLEYAHFNKNCGLTAYDAVQESVLNSKDPDWQTRNPSCPVSTVSLPTLGKTDNIQFTGGIGINGQAHQQTAVLKLSDTVDITGNITVDPADVGKTADIFVYAEATLPPSPETVYFMLGEGLTISLWDKNPNNLVAFQQEVTLNATQSVPMYSGNFIYPGTLKVYFGYRLPDGTLMLNEQPIDITILP